MFQVVEESGVPQHSKVRTLERVFDAEAAAHLGLEPDAPLVLIDRVRFAGDEPLAIDRIWLPAEIADPLLDADFTHTSLYNELERTIGKRPNEGWERIHPAIPTADHRSCLELDDDEAVFRIERLGTFSGEPLEVARHHDPRQSLHLRRGLERRSSQRAATEDGQRMTGTWR